jgi:hypothetical protein
MTAVGGSHVLCFILDTGFAVLQMISFTSSKLSALNTLANPLLLILPNREAAEDRSARQQAAEVRYELQPAPAMRPTQSKREPLEVSTLLSMIFSQNDGMLPSHLSSTQRVRNCRAQNFFIDATSRRASDHAFSGSDRPYVATSSSQSTTLMMTL